MKFYDTINKYKDKDIDLYVDMNGVIAEYDIGNFDYNTIRPLKSNIKRIDELINKNINVKILTICGNNLIINEKIDWIKKNYKEELIFLKLITRTLIILKVRVLIYRKL